MARTRIIFKCLFLRGIFKAVPRQNMLELKLSDWMHIPKSRAQQSICRRMGRQRGHGGVWTSLRDPH
jgi:hypothetical protein